MIGLRRVDQRHPLLTRHYLDGYPATTSGWRSIATVWLPVFLMGAEICTLRFSTNGPPAALMAFMTSVLVTEPKSLPLSPAFAGTLTVEPDLRLYFLGVIETADLPGLTGRLI